ncbi:uracil-DNA glycosylase [Legionella geestiana]|uniref:uracil-DNA glycosylase n=1 Tax=Legionella geestiana TaxID=45065 RepID=UPI001091FDDD|nr:uracil-DNA glycosylase [Legionella geestiana]QDQ39000.1 uracil-DNA glycosylase [Legionella geestiana]
MRRDLHPWYLQQLGIERWILRTSKPAASSMIAEDLDALAREVAACTRCAISACRTQTVFARGNPRARLMVIGEAPGFYEDREGKAFVGRAGQLLDAMLASIGMDEQQVYIANILKCRPPDNRDPTPDEIAACTPFLIRQIETVKPALILGLGRFAGNFLCASTLPMHRLRESLHHYQGVPCRVTFHPAYLLRNPQDKKKAWQDLGHVRSILDTAECAPVAV